MASIVGPYAWPWDPHPATIGQDMGNHLELPGAYRGKTERCCGCFDWFLFLAYGAYIDVRYTDIFVWCTLYDYVLRKCCIWRIWNGIMSNVCVLIIYWVHFHHDGNRVSWIFASLEGSSTPRITPGRATQWCGWMRLFSGISIMSSTSSNHDS